MDEQIWYENHREEIQDIINKQCLWNGFDSPPSPHITPLEAFLIGYIIGCYNKQIKEDQNE